MTDTTDNNNRKGGTLTIKRSTEQARVKQSFSHGRSKVVVVETRRKLRVSQGGDETQAALPDASPKPGIVPPEASEVQQSVAAVKADEHAVRAPEAKSEETNAAKAPPSGLQKQPFQVRPKVAPQATRPSDSSAQNNRSRVVLKSLTMEEKEARARALTEARVREADERKRQEEEVERNRGQEALVDKERDAAAQRLAAEEARRKVEEENKRKGEVVARKLSSPSPTKSSAQRPADYDEDQAAKANVRGTRREIKIPAPAKPTKSDLEKRRGRLTVSNALEEDEDRARSIAAFRRRTERLKMKAQGFQKPTEKMSREVVIPEAITIQDLAQRMAERAVDIIKLLMKQGQLHKINDVIDADTAELIAVELGHKVKRVAESDIVESLSLADDQPEKLRSRPPVVTIMGHVDHGKTSLLDAIRKTNVVSGEAGGITQHIGAYQVDVKGQLITFIDTPGHEAFTAMRARGAKATDIVVLVVAADDGVKPQTVEAISHAKAAQVPIIVAINKIDKPGSNLNRVRTDLLQHDIVVEAMGGDTLDVEVSALKGTNLDKLLDSILLQAELLDLKANPDREASGSVVEAQLDKGRGPVATVLVQRGTLRLGDTFVAGSAWGRVRALINDLGQHVKQAGPSVPVEVLGLNSAPEAGDQFDVVETEGRARDITGYRTRKRRETRGVAGGRTSLEQMMTQLSEVGRKEFPILVKADVQGSAEAIVQALEKIGNDEIKARIIHYGVGGVTESDIGLGATTGAVVLAFNVRANVQAREAAEKAGLEIRYYSIIYDLVDDIKAAMSGKLAPELRETFLGNARILQIFSITKTGKVAGCLVTEGNVQRGARVRLIRDDVVVHEGTLSTLRRFKDEVKEVQSGQECGMAFEAYQDMRVGDIIECFTVEKLQRKLQ